MGFIHCRSYRVFNSYCNHIYTGTETYNIRINSGSYKINMKNKLYNALFSELNPYFYIKVKDGRSETGNKESYYGKIPGMTGAPLIFPTIRCLSTWENPVKSKQQISTGIVIRQMTFPAYGCIKISLRWQYLMKSL